MEENEDRGVSRRWGGFLAGALALAAVGAPPACALRHEIFEPEPGNPGPGALTCTEVRIQKGQGPQLPQEEFRETWDPSLRVVTEQISPTETSSGKSTFVGFAWRYDAGGNLVARAGFANPDESYANFQYDYRYDDRGNLLDAHGSNPSVPDVKTPSMADTKWGTGYQNEYAGTTLTASTTAPYGPENTVPANRRTFRQNDLGQCDLVQTFAANADTPTTTETRTYDGAGRLETVTFVNADSSVPWHCVPSFTRRTYDDSGRLHDQRTWCAPGESGDADVVTTYQYGADGSQSIERMDFSSDTTNDVIQTPNGPRGLAHSILTRSPGCAAMDAAIGAPDGPECRVSDPEPRN